MVNLTMALDNDSVPIDLSESGARNTKKSLRLSRKKQLVLNRKREEIEQKEKEEKQKIENDRKEKEEDNTAVDIDEFDVDSKAKQKRHWESWAKADKDLFFEAISEFGKDFDKICSYMDRKAKTRGKSVRYCEPRNKDQIRYFYYRTWKQISKAVSLQPCESKRIQHEIYCLICYGELRKKCRGFGNKDLKRLDELVTTGSATVRYKGRKIRIKPPTCRFLKKLSDDEDKSAREQESIPESIDVELYPRSNQAWTMAQCLAYNPRIRLYGLPITLKVKSLMKLLQRRFNATKSGRNATFIQLLPPKGFPKGSDPGDVSPSRLQAEAARPVQSQSSQSQSSQSRYTDKACGDSAKPKQDSEADRMEINASLAPIGNHKPTSSGSTTFNDGSPTQGFIVPSSNQPETSEAVPHTGAPANVTMDVVTPLLGGNIIPTFIGKTLVSSPSVRSASSVGVSSPSSGESKIAEVLDTLESETSTVFFPITSENCIDKDLQTCYLTLDRPEVIRLEYELEERVNKDGEMSGNSFEKLVMLAQRDLCKVLKISTQLNKITSTAPRSSNQTLNFIDSSKLTNKPNFSGDAASEPSVPKQIIVNSNFLNSKTSTCVVPALTNVISPPPTNIVQRKVVPRLRPIQPASKTLMAKAVAVNIVPQPARLVQYAQVPPVSAQLINSGLPSLTVTNTASLTENPATVPTTSTVFSTPSTSSLSTKLTIWGHSTSEHDVSNRVQVEVIQEGSRTKAPVKRLHPTAVTTTEKPSKKPCLEESDTSKQPADLSEFDLSFLGTGEDSRSRTGSQMVADTINLSSILSGLTKNLRKNGTVETSESSNVVGDGDVKMSTTKGTVTPPRDSAVGQPPTVGNVSTAGNPSEKLGVSCVLTTPVKCLTKTPSKNDPTSESFKPVNFEHHWFGGDISELSLGGILDVGNLKEVAKNSDSSQASEISISNLLNDVGKKNKIANPTQSQGVDVPIGAILGTNEKKNENSKDPISQNNDLSLGKLLGALRKDEKTRNQTALIETVKSFNGDSLLMKPDADPVTVFESLMDENSIDYINKFKDLTAKLKADDGSTKIQTTASNELILENRTIPAVVTTQDVKDPKLPIYSSEDSVGLLDDLSFVLPTSDSNSNDFS